MKILLIALWPGAIELPWLPARQAEATLAPSLDRESSSAVLRPDTPAQPAEGSGFSAQPAGEAAQAGGSSRSDVARPWRITLAGALCAAWASGVAVVVVILILRIRAARRWRRRCVLVKDAEVLGLCETLAGELGVYQPPVLFVSESCGGPVVFGALRTSVVLPAKLLEQPDLKRLELVLRHELAHVRRGDLVWNWVATGIWCLFFFHPLVWLALHELRLNQELACDAWAASSRGTSPADYGSLLVDLAHQARAPSSILVTVGVVESFESLKMRLKAMSNLHATSRWVRPVSGAILSLAIIGLLPWRLVAQAPRGGSRGPARASGVTAPRSGGEAVSAAPIAATSATHYKITVDSVRRVKGSGLKWVDTGFPMAANLGTKSVDVGAARGSGQRAAGGFGRAGGGASSGGGG